MRTCTSSLDSMNSVRLLPAWRAAMFGWHRRFKRTGQRRSVTKSVTVGFEYTTATSISTSAAARRKSRSIGTARCTAKLGGICTRRVLKVVDPSLRISSRAYSRRSKDFMTAGRRCCPAFVSTSACGLRSNSWVPINFSRAITCRDKALCEINSALAAAVKLACLATPSKARNAFSGSQRRSMVVLPIASRSPALRVTDGAFLISDDGLGRQIQMIRRPKSGGGQDQHCHPQRGGVDPMTAGKPDAQCAYQLGSDDQIEHIGDQQGYRNEH